MLSSVGVWLPPVPSLVCTVPTLLLLCIFNILCLWQHSEMPGQDCHSIAQVNNYYSVNVLALKAHGYGKSTTLDFFLVVVLASPVILTGINILCNCILISCRNMASICCK